MTETGKRSWLGLAFRLAFTLACLGYLAATIPLRDFLGALRGIRWGLLGLALLILAANQPFLALRWKALLEAQGLSLSFPSVLRLNLVGLFFNTTMPGQTGGDLVKAYAAAKRFPGKGTAAVVTVFLDRAVGMLGLVTLAGGVSFVTALGDPRFIPAAWTVNGILGGMVLGGLLYVGPLKRKLLPPERIARLPWAGALLAEVDQALTLYRHHKGTVIRGWLLALVNHSGYILMGVAIGRALGIPPEQASLSQFTVLIAIVSMIGCLPVSIMGFGVGELAYVKAFGGLLGVAEPKALALSLLTRGCLIAAGLLGGLAVLAIRRSRPGPHALGASQ